MWCLGSTKASKLHSTSVCHHIRTMSDCKKCFKTLKSTSLKVECIDCRGIFHGKCVNISPTEIEIINNEEELWRCEPCGKLRRQSAVLESAITSEEVLGEFRTLREEISHLEHEMMKKSNSVEERFRNMELKLKDNAVDGIREMLEKLLAQNSSLQEKIKCLEDKIDEVGTGRKK